MSVDLLLHGAATDPRLPTVQEVLDLEVMQGAEILAGLPGMERRVRGVNIVEVPDVWQWLEGGELLLSAGYAWRNHPERLVDLATRLDQVGISGIAFKLGRYLDELPPDLLARADELGLPVIRLPGSVAYRDVIESLYGSLSSPKPGLPALPTRAKQAFLHFGLDEQSVEKVAGELAHQLKEEVHVIDLLDEEVVNASAQDTTQRERFNPLDVNTGRLISDLSARQLQRSPVPIDLHDRAATAAALVVGHQTYGYIVATTHDRSHEEFVASALAHAAELISFLLLKRLALFEGRREAGQLFFTSLMSDALTNERAAEIALTLGLRLTRPCMVVAMGTIGSNLTEEESHAIIRSLDRTLPNTPHVLVQEHCVAVLGLFQVADDGERLLARILERFKFVLQRQGARGKPIIATGSPQIGLIGVRRSRSEALIAYEAGERLYQEGIIRFNQLGVERLLAQIPKERMAWDYVASLLGPLGYDLELLRTVETYLQHGGNKVATAAAVPLHRSSLAYRLQKASNLLGVDLNSPERCLELWLAIRLRRILMLPDDKSTGNDTYTEL